MYTLAVVNAIDRLRLDPQFSTKYLRSSLLHTAVVLTVNCCSSVEEMVLYLRFKRTQNTIKQNTLFFIYNMFPACLTQRN